MSATALAPSSWSTSIYSSERTHQEMSQKGPYWVAASSDEENCPLPRKAVRNGGKIKIKEDEEEEVLWPPPPSIQGVKCGTGSETFFGIDMFCTAMCYAEDQRVYNENDPPIEIPDDDEHLLPLSPVQIKTHTFQNSHRSPSSHSKNKPKKANLIPSSPHEATTANVPDSPPAPRPPPRANLFPTKQSEDRNSTSSKKKEPKIALDTNGTLLSNDHMNEPSPNINSSSSTKWENEFRQDVVSITPSPQVVKKQESSPKHKQNNTMDQNNLRRRYSEPVKPFSTSRKIISSTPPPPPPPPPIASPSVMAELNRPDRTESDPTPSPEIERPKVQRSTSVDGGPMLTSALRTPNSERVKKRVSFSLPNEAELVSYSTRRRRSASTSPRNRRNHENSRRALSPQTSENNVDNSSRHHRPQRDSRRSNRYLSPSPTNQDYNYGSPTHRRKKELLSSSPPRDDNSSSSVVIPVLSPQQQQKKDGNEGVADITSDLTSGARVVRQPRADKLLFDSSQAKRSVSLDSNPSQSRPSLARRVSKSFLGSFRRDNSHNGVASSV